jgi:hypothetical protein
MHPAAVSAAGGKDRNQILAHQPTVEECAEGGVTGVRCEFEYQQMLHGQSEAILFPALTSPCLDEVEVTSEVLGEFVEAQFRRE